MSERRRSVRIARQLERLAGGAWRVDREEELLHVEGPAGAFAVVPAGAAAPAVPGAQLVVVTWEDFPEEVAEAGGVFHVHGERLVDFLLAQPAESHASALERYELAGHED